MITIQYLENSPELDRLDPGRVVDKLRSARDRLPFSHLLIGWHVPPRLLEACRKEAERLGVRFLRWHPLLTSDGSFPIRPEWQVVGLTGRRGVNDCRLPEFTFLCPNHPGVRHAVDLRMGDLLREGLYQGFFLDRIRFPSPAANPLDRLACFCDHCRQRAADIGLDLEQVREAILELTGKAEGRLALVQVLLGGKNVPLEKATAGLLHCFLNFRLLSVTDFISVFSAKLRASGMEVGLDCFSPSLTGMVGQDLKALGEVADWIKIMSYAHTLGPAGLPYELLGFSDFLSSTGLSDTDVLAWMSAALVMPLPERRASLKIYGLSSQALEQEVACGVKATRIPLLAGIELVSLKNVVHLNQLQIRADLSAVKRAGAGGLSISWDLRHIPLHRLDLVRKEYLGR